MKKLVALVFTLLFLVPYSVMAAEDSNVLLYVNGEVLAEDSNAFIEKDRTFVPLRNIAEMFGYQVKWDEDSQSIDMERNGKKLHMKIGEKKYSVDSKSKEMDVVPFIKESKTYVPVRFIAEAFGETIQWDGDNKVVLIGNYSEPTTGKEKDTVTFEHLNLSLQISKDIKENLLFVEKKDTVTFFDRKNYENPKDKGTGMLFVLSKSALPYSNTIPGIVLEYSDGVYTEAIFASDVQYSREDKSFKESYDESVALSKELLKTYQPLEKENVGIKPESVVGYIVIENNKLYLDTVEIITLDDTERIEKLALSKEDNFPNGYYIYNPNKEKEIYQLTEETIYNFVDANLLFVNNENGDRLYTTTKKEEFMQHLNQFYSDVPPAQRVPFFLEIKEGKVVTITEKLEFSI